MPVVGSGANSNSAEMPRATVAAASAVVDAIWFAGWSVGRWDQSAKRPTTRSYY